jgi:hypothetical protein
VAIRASETKSLLLPLFIGYIQLELQMSRSSLPLSHTGATNASSTAFGACAGRASLLTKLIGAHVIHTILRGQTPIIVSNGVNALSTKWLRVQTYMKLVYQTYGNIMLVLRLPAIANTERLQTVCPNKDEEFSYGFFITDQITEATDLGFLAWKAKLF